VTATPKPARTVPRKRRAWILPTWVGPTDYRLAAGQVKRSPSRKIMHPLPRWVVFLTVGDCYSRAKVERRKDTHMARLVQTNAWQLTRMTSECESAHAGFITTESAAIDLHLSKRSVSSSVAEIFNKSASRSLSLRVFRAGQQVLGGGGSFTK
jgi:hypothetical protein